MVQFFAYSLAFTVKGDN
ncbi:membrane protein YoeI, partial [Klebsiella pneumoniae]